MASIAVVHLVRAKNGTEPLRRFLESYARYPGGMPHDLWIVFKGFTPPAELAPVRALLEEFPHQALFTRDVGYDIRPYFLAARHTDYAYYSFLNSFSVLLDEFWLAKLYELLTRVGVGLVGATGSYESQYSNLLAEVTQRDRGLPRRVAARLALPLYRTLFDPFPSAHLRTNAFLISGRCLKQIRPPPLFCKLNAYCFESGKRSLTRQVQAMHLRVLLAGRDGHGYEEDDWSRSNTFRQGNQDNLLVADNQTALYARADEANRVLLSARAWGEAGAQRESRHSLSRTREPAPEERLLQRARKA